MTQKNKKLVSLKVKQTNEPQKILKISIITNIVKPLNGTTSMSKTSHLLKLQPISYVYDKNKTAQSTTFFIKGLRGIVRHTIMKVCLNLGLEVCHSSDKEIDKHGNLLLPEGFHLIGSCLQEDKECIVHKIFGSRGHEGIISVYAPAITSINHKTAVIDRDIQPVHIATEKRIVLSADNKTMQDFGERYFSGNFHFEINVTKCQPDQLGLLVHAITELKKLGRGYNAGYGHIEVKELQLLDRTSTTSLVQNGQSFKVKKSIEEHLLLHEVATALNAWNSFVVHESQAA